MVDRAPAAKGTLCGTGTRSPGRAPCCMKSVNFEFIRGRRPHLADLGGFAEQYLAPDPQSCLVKLRLFAENFVNDVYSKLGLTQGYESNLSDLLNGQPFASSVPGEVLSKLHVLRRQGNKAAHGDRVTGEMAERALREAFDLSRWIHVAIDRKPREELPAYQRPAPGGAVGSKAADLKRQKKEILQKLAAREAEMERLLEQLEEERRNAAEARKTTEELQAILAAGSAAAKELSFNEAETRKYLVDTMLADAGWDLTNLEEVRQEVPIQDQPTDSGEGFADYVLYDDDGKPLAVVEAKRTRVEPSKGRAQARIYADGLEKEHGQRPVLFYTNGFEIWIWNDADGEVDRRIWGFYSKDSLQFIHRRREQATPVTGIEIDQSIVDRPYQIEMIKRVTERFADAHRKALVVQATGTGKTRVAIGLVDRLMRANRIKRVLFLCDRRELRKQAQSAFTTHLPNASRITVTGTTHRVRDKQIYFATYPAMKKVHETYDPGFFDLIIADESHRSIYNRYRDLFQWFDALQVGLTATPVGFIDRNTYELFHCEDRDPTAYYPLEEAIQENYLVPFRVESVQTAFQRSGMKWQDLSEEQRRQLELQIADAEDFDFRSEDLDRLVFNKDTNRQVLRNLMDKGIRDPDGQGPGKTIIFARSHRHAVLLKQLFSEMYPQLGGGYCTVIDNYDPRAEQLIDDFKGQGTHNDIRIAISVDMLDTGIDVPEVVNLVFAKPVKSYVKFWQMIGRGTRLCRDLFGPGQDKTEFRIFDHWGNFDHFGETYREPDSQPTRSLLQQLLEARIELAASALKAPAVPVFDAVIDLIAADLQALADANTIKVREAWKTLEPLRDTSTLKQFDATSVAALKQQIAPLMRERDIRGQVPAYQLDLLIAELQRAVLTGSAAVQDLRGDLLNSLAGLQMNLAQVKEKTDTIARVRDKGDTFWRSADFFALEKARLELRGIMQYREHAPDLDVSVVVDVKEDASLIDRRSVDVSLRDQSQIGYRKRVYEALESLRETDPTLSKIRRGEPLDEGELAKLASLVLTQNPDVDLGRLELLYPDTAGHLDHAIRRVVGLDMEAVEERLAAFRARFPSLTATQDKFLKLVARVIAEGGGFDEDRLYEAPFTQLDTDGLDGVFPEEDQADKLLSTLEPFRWLSTTGEENRH